ncbi:MAG: DUF1929 domain-containing protein [Planctomycetes bacterium]|nr:DUF1929 domain-containing protein [Planctomycetota bacterium]
MGSAQALPGSWSQAHVWFPWPVNPDGTQSCPLPVNPPNNCGHCEVAHAALIGKPGPLQGKILLWRTTEGAGRYLFDPAQPSTVTSAGAPPGNLDVFCSGQSFDANGDLILAGGDRTGSACQSSPSCSTSCLSGCGNLGYWTEPNWTIRFDPNGGPSLNDRWTRPAGLLPWGSDLMTPVPPYPIFPGPPANPSPGHYYPATVVLHDGRVMQIGGGSAPFTPPPANCCWPGSAQPPAPGDVRSNWCQVFDPITQRWQGYDPGNPSLDSPVRGLPTGVQPNGDTINGFRFYPLTHLLSTEEVFVSEAVGGGTDVAAGRRFSPSAVCRVSNWPPALAAAPWTILASKLRNASGQVVDLLYPTAVMLPWRSSNLVGDDRVWMIGGSDTNIPYQSTVGRSATGLVWEIFQPQRTVGSAPVWAPISPLNHPRIYANAIVLPTMQVLVLGGSANYFAPYGGLGTPTSDPEVLAQPVLTPEICDLEGPNAGQWRNLQPHASPRLYHNVAVLLPDGRVLHAGGYKGDRDIAVPTGPNHRCRPAVTWTYTDAEVFTPPYLDPGSRRPVIQTVPATVTYGSSITATVTVEDDDIPLSPADEIDYGFVVRCASVTHHFDWDQKSMKLDVLSRTATTVTFAPLPTMIGNGPSILPPGFYMLFVIRKPNASVGWRVPSVAKFIQVI